MILDEIIKEAGEEKCEDRVLAWASIKKLQCKEEFGKEDKKGGQLGSRRPQEKDMLYLPLGIPPAPQHRGHAEHSREASKSNSSQSTVTRMQRGASLTRYSSKGGEGSSGGLTGE